jgi:aspartate racemase
MHLSQRLGGRERVNAYLRQQAESGRCRFPDLPRQHHSSGVALRGAAIALPWLHIAEEVAREATARGFKTLAITGTRWLVDGNVYPDALTARGLAYMRPTPEERDEINRIIMDELVCGVFKPEAVTYFQRVYARMKDAGCDAVVLGCTEIPLIMNDANSPLPTLDSTRLLARAALLRAVAL